MDAITSNNSFIFAGNFVGYVNDSTVESSEAIDSNIVIDDSAGNLLLGVGGFIGTLSEPELNIGDGSMRR